MEVLKQNHSLQVNYIASYKPDFLLLYLNLANKDPLSSTDKIPLHSLLHSLSHYIPFMFICLNLLYSELCSTNVQCCCHCYCFSEYTREHGTHDRAWSDRWSSGDTCQEGTIKTRWVKWLHTCIHEMVRFAK